MMGIIIFISVLVATIPVGFFNPTPLDDLTININLDQSPKGSDYATGLLLDRINPVGIMGQSLTEEGPLKEITNINQMQKKANGRQKEQKKNDINNTPKDGILSEGDMILSKYQVKWLYGNSKSNKSNETSNEQSDPIELKNARLNFQWPHNIVSYFIDKSVGQMSKTLPKLIQNTLKTLERKLSGCIKFHQKPVGELATVNVVSRTRGKDAVCKSPVGFYGKVIELELGDTPLCRKKFTIEHEFLHAVGIYHTQGRSDRDDFLIIHTKNIEPGEESLFEKYDKSSVSHFGLPYDYWSVMQYAKNTGGVLDQSGKQKITMETKDPEMQDILGTATKGVSRGDVELVRRFYKCSKEGRCNGEDSGCCTKANPCNENEGACHNDEECKAHLECGQDNCPWGGPGYYQDCCYNPNVGRCNGARGCCTKEKPCEEKDGHCHFDYDCKGDLKCGIDNCPWRQSTNCCYK